MTVLAAFTPVTSAEDKETSQRFQLTIASKANVKTRGVKREETNDVKLLYSLRFRGREAVLIFDTLAVKTVRDLKTVADSTMSRMKFSYVLEGNLVEVKAEDAPAELKRDMQDRFGAPLCRVLYDADGKETKRTLLVRPGARALLRNGMLINALLFHAPFPAGRRKWQAEREFGLGFGGSLKGTLTYETVGGAKDGPITVKVSGTLKNDSFQPPESPFIVKDVRYVARGEQTYDPARRKWVSGKLTLEGSLRVEGDGKEVGSSKTSVHLSLKALPADN
jgi:hypothetical protein